MNKKMNRSIKDVANAKQSAYGIGVSLFLACNAVILCRGSETATKMEVIIFN